jgi:two-component system sensor histidine kinase RegB
VAAKEIERRAGRVQDGEALVQDAELIREELERCRAVLDRMSAAGGQHVGETLRALPVETLFEEVRSRLSDEQARRWETHSEVASLEVPREAFVQMIENVARNGFDACEEGRVSLHIASRDGVVELVFADEGCGMSEETLKRATDPFFTTKSAADRMGLGLFLARTLVDSLGGDFEIDSAIGRGTTIRIALPQRS